MEWRDLSERSQNFMVEEAFYDLPDDHPFHSFADMAQMMLNWRV
jgi:hypothetical protein